MTLVLDDFDIFRIIIASIFLFLAILVLRKDKDRITISFSLTPIFYTIWGILEIFNNGIGLDGLRILTQLIFITGPIGVLLAGYFIYYGKTHHTAYWLLILIGLYILVAQICGIISLFGEIQADTVLVNIARGVYNVLICIPLVTSAVIYYLILKETPELAKKLFVLISGIVLVIIGQLINGIAFYMTGNFFVGSFVLIILGLITATVSFTRVSTQSNP